MQYFLNWIWSCLWENILCSHSFLFLISIHIQHYLFNLYLGCLSPTSIYTNKRVNLLSLNVWDLKLKFLAIASIMIYRENITNVCNNVGTNLFQYCKYKIRYILPINCFVSIAIHEIRNLAILTIFGYNNIFTRLDSQII